MAPAASPSSSSTIITTTTITTSSDNSVKSSSLPPLAQSTVYNQYFPIIVVCLVSLYSVAYIARWIRWHYRRRRKRAMWLERGRLRMYWHQALLREENNHHCQVVAMSFKEDEHQLPQIPPPVATAIPRPATFPSTNITSTSTTTTTTTSTTLTSDESLFSRPRSITFFNSPSTSTAASSYTSSSTLHHSPTLPPTPPVLPDIPPPIKQSWIYNNKRKRRRLMWQWSVAMGYCRYSHAARMENVIASIQQGTNEKTDDIHNCI
ncbi:hypothetical protein O0I10_010063 [Lichtheimia ornata]|uniref:Uncharacterized protein n=1 Tax=Lichtheimia ornata TaxID=688661 RepID=A0AAD7UWH6_9FUNG|nr:uncharacterized protein O0I10_010063 [Lichtheimia ornata]KAJ8654241.1 hypothetical protein O0I10_010063 [Lichtheimia ornata]